MKPTEAAYHAGSDFSTRLSRQPGPRLRTAASNPQNRNSDFISPSLPFLSISISNHCQLTQVAPPPNLPTDPDRPPNSAAVRVPRLSNRNLGASTRRRRDSSEFDSLQPKWPPKFHPFISVTICLTFPKRSHGVLSVSANWK
jgi:hypothetical protein